MESPTHVGNTGAAAALEARPPVHPHACGEYPKIRLSSATSLGSSPRVWGIRGSIILPPGMSRFIPTRVGNTPMGGVYSVQTPVHPHACGEYGRTNWCRTAQRGSSPRVWGIPALRRTWKEETRFIPTRVGNTLQEDARNNSLLAELQRATEPCVLQACSEDDKKGKELCKAAPSPRKTLPGRAVSLS